MTLRGLWIPSKIWSKIPGPSSTERGCLVLSTGSPTVSPAEYIYDYMCPNSIVWRLNHRLVWWFIQQVYRSQLWLIHTFWIHPFFLLRQLYSEMVTWSWYFKNLAIRAFFFSELFYRCFLLHSINLILQNNGQTYHLTYILINNNSIMVKGYDPTQSDYSALLLNYIF